MNYLIQEVLLSFCNISPCGRNIILDNLSYPLTTYLLSFNKIGKKLKRVNISLV